MLGKPITEIIWEEIAKEESEESSLDLSKIQPFTPDPGLGPSYFIEIPDEEQSDEDMVDK